MTNQLILLPGEFIRLTEDETLNTSDLGYGRWQLLEAMGVSHLSPAHIDCPFPAGTVFKVGSYRVTNNTNPKYNQIALLVVHSDNKKWLPKSRGGTGRRTNLHLPVTTHFVKWSFERANPDS